jgi:hypothetical protein
LSRRCELDCRSHPLRAGELTSGCSSTAPIRATSAAGRVIYERLGFEAVARATRFFHTS